MSEKVIFHAHDKAEGSAPDFKEYLRIFCAEKQLDTGKLRLNRYFKTAATEERRITREVIAFIFTKADASAEERKRIWQRYFNKPADSLYEHVRRAIIIHGDLDDFAKQCDLSHESVNSVLRGIAPTFSVHDKIAPYLDCGREQADAYWRSVRGPLFLERWPEAPLAAHAELLLEENKTSVRQWTDNGGTLPPLMQHLGKNEVKRLFSGMRAGMPILWDRLETLLDALHPLPEDAKQRRTAMDRRRMITLSWVRAVHLLPAEEREAFACSVDATQNGDRHHVQCRALAAALLSSPQVAMLKPEDLLAPAFDFVRLAPVPQEHVAPDASPVAQPHSAQTDPPADTANLPPPAEKERRTRHRRASATGAPKQRKTSSVAAKLNAADLYARFMEQPGVKTLRLELFMDVPNLFRRIARSPDKRESIITEIFADLNRPAAIVQNVRRKIENAMTAVGSRTASASTNQ